MNQKKKESEEHPEQTEGAAVCHKHACDQPEEAKSDCPRCTTGAHQTDVNSVEDQVSWKLNIIEKKINFSLRETEMFEEELTEIKDQ